MKNKFKSPKTNENKLFNNDVESVLIGLMVFLISIIGLLNKGPVGNFFTYIGIYLFGAFYFLIYVIAILCSIYLMIRKKGYKVKINMHLLGAIFIFVSCIIASSKSSTALTLTNFTGEFSERMNTVSSQVFVVDSIENLAVCGGGFIGYLLKALFNTCITEVGTMIVYIILMVVGIVALLKDVIAYLIRFFVNFNWKKGKNRNSAVKQVMEKSFSSSSDESDSVDTLVLSQSDNAKVTNNFNFEKVNNLVASQDPTPIQSYFQESKKEEPTLGSSLRVNEIEELSIPRQENKIKDYFADEVDETNSSPAKKDYFSDNFGEEKAQTEANAPEIKSFEESKTVIPQMQVNESVEVKVTPMPEKEKVEEPKSTYQPISEIKAEPAPAPAPSATVEVKVAPTPAPTPAPAPAPTPKPFKAKNYVYPSPDLLKYHPCEDTKAINQQEAEIRVEKINKTFQQFKIGAQVISYTIGPSVTRFNVRMNEGVRVNTLSTITNEISIALNGDKTVRVELIVEGRDTSSIEVGNVKATPVSYKECFDQIKDRTKEKEKLLIPLGKDIEGKVVCTSMDELPHLLVAGTTGSGKSVFVNTIIATFIMRNRPDELRLILVDPKKVEFSRYANLPHLLCPIITESREASAALAKLCEEMDDRYARLSLRGVSKISEYNELAEIKGFEKMSSIVLVVDEFADLLSSNAKEINQSVQRLCQKARAAGIYLIICTQRPSVNVVTGDIKAVIPSRIALLVPQANDSKVILDSTGAESLLGNGDMLCQIPKHSSLVRLQGAYVSGVEIALICEAIKEQCEVNYDPKFCNLIPVNQPGGGAGGERKLELDELHEEAKAHVIETRIASTSNLQSYFQIGYARADHILNCLEQEGIVKRASGNRRIVVAKQEGSDEE